MAASQINAYGGELLMDEPLAKHTTWRVGGPARCFYRPLDAVDLGNFLRQLPVAEPVLWLGLGSNLLLRDGGFEGTVIATKGRLNEIAAAPGLGLSAGAGAACAHVARQAARMGLCGAAFLAGIPGTMGGALAMNAGAFGSETWDFVRSVQTMDPRGEIRQRKPADFTVAYRRVEGPADEWFIGCELQLETGDVEREQAEIQRLLAQRNETQPVSQASGGSTFRNPPGDYAARLIESAGLKGYTIGGASVSTKHANFIINTGRATAADIEQLIEHLRSEVMARHGVLLEPEVHIAGSPK